MAEAKRKAEARRRVDERAETRRPRSSFPAAGPHAKPELTNEAATPGAGALPDPNREVQDIEGGVG